MSKTQIKAWLEIADKEPDNDKTRTHLALTKGVMVQRYRIVDKIGTGGMGEVYLAEDTELERRVALKFLPTSMAQDSDLRARFTREAQATAKLNHPNVVTIYEVSEQFGRPFIAMELVEGQTLSDLSKGNKLDVNRIIEIAIQLCDGLGAAHEKEVVHRDIKPSNIVVDSHGRPKILDFGLAAIKGGDNLTKTGSTLGTVRYMSPEQVQGQEIDSRSDLFSLGVLLYELIAGRTPFEQDNEAATLRSIINDNPEPLARYKADVPDELQRTVSKLLEKQTSLRYQHAEGVTSDLKRLIAPSGSTIIGTPAKAKSNSKMPVIVAGLVLVILASALILKPWKSDVSSTQEAVAQEDRLAIMYFHNLADPNDTLRQGEIVASLLITDISASTELKVVSSQRLYDILKLLGREGAKTIDRDVATQVANKANAKWMLTGNILRTEPNVILTAQLVDVATGNVLTSSRIDGAPGEDIFGLVDSLTDDITSRLDVPAATISESPSVAEMTTNSPDAYRYFLDGEELFNRFQFFEASKAFEKAIAADSNFTLAYYMRSHSGDNPKYYIQKAKERIDNVPELLRMIILAQEAVIQDSVIKAIKLHEEIATKYPEEKGVLTYLGVLYARWPIRDFRSSVNSLLKSIEIDPLNKMAYSILADSYNRLGDADSSIWAINEYIKIAPNEPNPYYVRGNLYAQNGQLKQAIESYKRALTIDPGYGSALRSLAYSYLYSGNIAEASRLMRERASHINKNVRLNGLAGLKNISLYQGKLRKAYERYEYFFESSRIEANKGKIPAWHYSQRKDFALLLHELTGERQWADSAFKALDSYDSLILNNPSSTVSKEALIEQTTSVRADTWLKLGEVERADSMLRSLPKKAIDTTDMLNLTRFRLNEFLRTFYHADYDSAAHFANLAIDANPLFTNYAHLGHALLLAGKIGESVAALEKAERNYDNLRSFDVILTVRVHYWLAQAYEASGWNDKAIQKYEQFLEIWKDADDNIIDLKNAKERLAKLKA